MCRDLDWTTNQCVGTSQQRLFLSASIYYSCQCMYYFSRFSPQISQKCTCFCIRSLLLIFDNKLVFYFYNKVICVLNDEPSAVRITNGDSSCVSALTAASVLRLQQCKKVWPHRKRLNLGPHLGFPYHRTESESGLCYHWVFVNALFLALQKLAAATWGIPKDATEHYSIFMSLLFYPLRLSAGAAAGYVPRSSNLCSLIAMRCSYFSHIFLFCVLMQRRRSSDWSGALSGDSSSLDINGSPHNCRCH